MRRLVTSLSCLVLVSGVLVLGACGSDKKEVKPAATTTTPAGAVTTTTVSPVTTATAAATTTSATCPNTGPTAPTSTPAAQAPALLTKVAVTTAACRDSVTFTFRKSGSAVPSCTLSYQPGPFSKDGSGAPVAVAGTAFLAVRCAPAYGYDFANGATTYTGPKTITPTATRHVRAVVETGDNEGVLSWVIGLDQQRAYGIAAGGTPTRQLTVTFS